MPLQGLLDNFAEALDFTCLYFSFNASSEIISGADGWLQKFSHALSVLIKLGSNIFHELSYIFVFWLSFVKVCHRRFELARISFMHDATMIILWYSFLMLILLEALSTLGDSIKTTEFWAIFSSTRAMSEQLLGSKCSVQACGCYFITFI